ncbi:MAG: class I SAM-dependent methyltransferase [Hyphomicrobiales bacterium]|nr:class I SAM-dependent methyltransferase [Hyphomicrobiales bacterium]
MSETAKVCENVFGAPLAELVGVSADAVQFSPLAPGAQALEDVAPGSLGSLAMLAPAGAIERRYALALALRALAPDAQLTVLAPKDKGGARLAKELSEFGCAFTEEARRHHRICRAHGPAEPSAIAAAIEAGAPRFVEAVGLWSQPGVFSWNRVDPGSALLLAHLPRFAGRGADFGCGLGALGKAALAAPQVATLAFVDADRRAVAMAARNVVDPRAQFLWADARRTDLAGLDFIVSNPPFHEAGVEDRQLGQSFIQSAARALRKGGALWLVANRHLPYEAVLQAAFGRTETVASEGGYKIFRAQA